ncbi:Secreted effector protein SseB [Arsenophonus nasoniae]|nr:Secreted effector protein SseB [Arsenophonus nasoniae]
MRDNGITVDGMTIDQYLAKNGKDLDQGKLQAVKAALETVSNRASDFVSQSQLQLQKVMQSYNVTVSLINSMQTMLAEMNKSIAQNIR